MQQVVAKLLFTGLLVCQTGISVQAADLTGVWADNASACGKVFVKKGNTISFARDADMHGSGLIFEKNRVRGKIATCSIKSQKQDGNMIHMITVCSTDVALQNVQFSVKVDGDNAITRIFPGIPELQMNYTRCSL